ncbi:DUF4883 family protein [Clostridium sp. SYSU_GA19001]|uniref:DUF4883 family protein n=1 Tax=Clostridium caldaquaticum TaxID=2940653 RepID=UPI00207773D8|nr:DUF4883 family protein [Clostridium caldaquaticum]MCM8710352.1 DUF4883 family protein [Clostridium caldaquaticum]
MKKKLLNIFIFLIIPVILTGCTVKIGSYTINNFTLTRKKPNNLYYTNNLVKNLTFETTFKVNALDTNFYKEKELSKEDIDTIKNFTKALKKTNFIEKPKELPEKASYKLYFTFNKDKYVINIYNERYISVYPWDGTYSMDYIDMTGIQPLYNLFNLCEYLYK